jgi:lysophospholipase L1-like esterase
MRSRLVALLALAVLGTACAGADEGVKTAPDTTVLSEISSTPLPSTSTAPDLTTLVPRTLVALGDSFASGVGARTMTPTCGRSAYGWTGLLAEDLGMNFVNLACSGATLPDTVEQVNQLPANADVVAITTGGNSLKFGQAVVRCLTGKCEAAWETAQANLSSIRPDTLKLLKDTHQAVPGVSAIALTLYPAATRPGLLCGKVTDEISTLFPRGTAMLNAELRAAAEEAIAQGVPVVVIDPVEFSTHTLCSDEPWFHDFDKGLLVMHLNDAGYEAMAAASLAALLAASK